MVSYYVSSRAQEIGIRTALGAENRDIVFMVWRQTSVVVVTGILIGVACAAIFASLLRNLVFEVNPLDPAITTVIVLSVFLIALSASYVPAIRAVKLDPLKALKTS